MRENQKLIKINMNEEKHKYQTELYKCIKAFNIEHINEQDKIELLKLFSVTDNPLIFNHIALIFSDIQLHTATRKIINKILSGKYDNYVGTLVYALENLDCKKDIIAIIKILCTKDYEARLHAFEIVEKNANSISKKNRTIALDILKKAKVEQKKTDKNMGENSTIHFIEQTIQLLEL